MAEGRKSAESGSRNRPVSLWRRIAAVGQAEKLPIMLTAAVAALIFVFAQIAALVSAGNTRAFDEWLLLALREAGDDKDPIGPAWLSEMMRDFTALGSTGVVTLIVLIAALFLIMTRKRHAAFYVIFAVVSGTFLNNLLKIGFARPRPDIVAHSAEVFTASFPSGHSMMSAVVYLTLGTLLARSQQDPQVKTLIFSVCVLLTLLIGFSRVYLGVHWPTDVIAGWTLGAGWAFFCWILMLWLQARGQVENDR